MKYKDYYNILDINRNASKDEIKKAYRRLARKYHPDVSKDPHAEARFKELGEAYEVLKDPGKRIAYDRLGANWKTGQDFRPPLDGKTSSAVFPPGSQEVVSAIFLTRSSEIGTVGAVRGQVLVRRIGPRERINKRVLKSIW
jgi:DnaJ-class molecular chaperone